MCSLVVFIGTLLCGYAGFLIGNLNGMAKVENRVAEDAFQKISYESACNYVKRVLDWDDEGIADFLAEQELEG